MKLKPIKIYFLLLMLCNISKISAQVYGNEWIDYNKTYYKVSIASNSICRITAQTLFNAGLPTSTNGADLQLFRDGIEVPLFIQNNGQLIGTDNIEFIGKTANGLLDAEVYKTAAYQLNPDLNLISDSAYYFFTVNTASANLRYTLGTNNLSGTLPVAENYCWSKIALNYRGALLPGNSYNADEQFQSCHFDEGEGYVKSYFNSTSDIVNTTLTNLYKQTGAPNIITKSKYVGFPLSAPSLNWNHQVRININNVDITDSTFSGSNGCGNKVFNIQTVPSTMPSNNVLAYKATAMQSAGNDRVGLAYLNIYYPKQFNFSNSTFEPFEMDAKPNPYYLEITNFNTSSLQPKLFDVTNKVLYMGDVQVAGKIRFLLPATASRTVFKLINQDPANDVTINNAIKLNFEALNNTNRDGDYIILTNKYYFDDGSGNNFIQYYANYRQSAAGGSHKVSIVDFQQIYDQFGYGNNMHVAGVRRFLKYAKDKWNTQPNYLFIIGKGVLYNAYKSFSDNINANPNVYPYKTVTPTFGNPGSDVLMADINKDNVQDFKVGRLSVWTASQINDYLTKVIEYERQQTNTSNQIVDSILWKKNVLHIAGGNSDFQQGVITAALNLQAKIIKDTTFGGNVFSIAKQTTNNIDLIASAHVDSLMNNGVGLIQYYGHGSTSKLAFALGDPNTYTNYGKYSVFIANGCDVGDFFEIVNQNGASVSELAVLQPNRGSIAFIAGTSTTWTNNIEYLTDTLYTQFAKNSYLSDLGTSMQNTVKTGTNNALLGSLFKTQFEQVLLHGDPLLKFNNFSKPDYAVEQQYASFSPITVNISLDSFKLLFNVFNLAKYQKDSFNVVVRRNINGANSTIIYQKKYPQGLAFSDTLAVNIPINKSTDKGLNNFEISVDDNNTTDEVTKTNNKIIKQITIYDNDLIPTFPYNYSIVHNQNLNLFANSSNPFATNTNYIVQIDTTIYFNSPVLKSTNIQSTGGVVEWNPNITLLDSIVYYWRAAKDSVFGNGERNWKYSSFVFLKNGSDGWNQSHYFQYTNDNFKSLIIDSSRKFDFTSTSKSKLEVNCATMLNPAASNFTPYFQSQVSNDQNLYFGGCTWNELQFVIIDSLTGNPLHSFNYPNWGGTTGCSGNGDQYFAFNFKTIAQRQKIMKFLDSIPTGFYISMIPFIVTTGGNRNTIFAQQMKADTATLGSGISLYHKLINLGFSNLDSFTSNRPFVFITRKGIPNFSAVHRFEIDSTINLKETFYFNILNDSGTMESPIIGKASKWTNFLKSGYPNDGIATDTCSVSIYGIDTSGIQSILPLANVYGNDTSLSFINAAQYPYLKLVYNNTDKKNKTAEQLKYWRIMYDPVPDLAIAPNINFSFKDNYEFGELAPMQIAIKNVSSYAILDSINVKCTVYNKSNLVTENLNIKIKPLAAFESTIANFSNINTKLLYNNSSFNVNVNPNKNPSEQTYFNNTALKQFVVNTEKINPIIDATFDGVHILKDDIISAKPFIQFKIKDENKYLKLDDSSLVNISIRRPLSSNFEPLIFDNDTLKFIKATDKENAAYIQYKPNFTKHLTPSSDFDLYEIDVTAKDKSSNSAGSVAYKSSFKVITKESISNLINYPNPFSTSTQFVFTLTGSYIPSFMKIQIMTVTGKIVKEITKNELGSIHVGKNITDYKWDGTDQFGQKLANGVYFYRLICNEGGNAIDKFNLSQNDNNIDKMFKNGFGKLYIMR